MDHNKFNKDKCDCGGKLFDYGCSGHDGENTTIRFKCEDCEKIHFWKVNVKEYLSKIGRKGGQANKKGKRPDLKKGGKTWQKRWGKADLEQKKV